MKKVEKSEKPSEKAKTTVQSLVEFKKRYFPATANPANDEQTSKTPEEVGVKIGKRAAGIAQLFSTSKK